MEENIDVINANKNEFINKSIIKPLKAGKILMIVGWSLLIFSIGIYPIIVGCYIIGIQFIRKQRLAQGICIMLFGWLSLGIWPFVVAVREIKRDENKVFDVVSINFKKSTIEGYEVAKILLIIGIPVMCAGILLSIIDSRTNLFFIGYIIIVCGTAFTSIQDFRRDKLAHGICIDLFGVISLGIWPLIYAMKQSKKFKEENLNSESCNIIIPKKVVSTPVIEGSDIKSSTHINEEQENVSVVEEYRAGNISYDRSSNVNNFGNSEQKPPNDKKIKLILIGLIIAASIVLITLILVIVSATTMSARATYIIYDPITVFESYGTTPENLVMVPKIYEYSIDTETMDQVLVCGNDIPIGEYTMDIESDDSFRVYMQSNGEVADFDEEIEDGDVFECKEGYHLRYGGSTGYMSLISSTEKEALEETLIIDTSMTTTFHENGEVNEITCTEDYEDIECSSLATYDVLVEKTIKAYENSENQTKVVETMEKRIFSTTCLSSEEGPIFCEEAVTYEELIQNLE